MEPGTELDSGKYRIVRPLGRGGMSAVYEALNTRSRKRVAIKCLLPSLALSSPDATERLMREAEASCRVRHPNVVDVYDVCRDDQLVFLVMQYLEGEPLTAALERGELPMYRLIMLLLAAMRAVAEAHKQGVVHRDIKPDNIFLAREADVADPVPKVLDFGISKLQARDTQHISLTRAGVAIGTPMYMSYEQLLGADDIDGRADVYAFGVVLYEALTGRPPYEARSHAEWLLRFAVPPPSPKCYREEIPSSLDRLIMWCLACDRDQRVPSMEALINELTPFAQEHSYRNLMTVPSLSSAERSRLEPTPGHAVAALLERLSARRAPAATSDADGDAGDARGQRASSRGNAPNTAREPSAELGFLRRRRWFMWGAGLAVALLLIALALLSRLAARPDEASETAVHGVRAAPMSRAAPQLTADPPAQRAAPAADSSAAELPTGRAEPFVEPAPARPSAATSPKPTEHPHPHPAPASAIEREPPPKPTTDWGIY